MITITNAYCNLCKEKYFPLGFIKNKQTFARISNDVLQSFTLKPSHHSSTVTVDFAILPLCFRLPDILSHMQFPILSIGGYELNEFIVDLNVGYIGWTFNPLSADSIRECALSITETIDHYLIPLFQRCIDCESALPEIIKLDKLFDQNRQTRLRLLGESNCAAPWQELSMFDSRKYYMALKAKNYGYARSYLEHQIRYYHNELQILESENTLKQSEITVHMISAKYNYSCEQLEMLQSGNISYFDRMVEFNEKEMHKLLLKQHPQLYRE